jgi:hypothetical protein
MKITNEHLAGSSNEELTELAQKIENIKKVREQNNPAKKTFLKDKEELRKKYEQFVKKYSKIETTAQLPVVKLTYSLGDILPQYEYLISEWGSASVSEIKNLLISTIDEEQAYDYFSHIKVEDSNATAAQKRLIKEYIDENPPCFDFVKFFAKDVWRNIEKDYESFAKEFEAFAKKHKASIEGA